MKFEDYATATEQLPGSDIKELVRLAFESAIRNGSVSGDQTVVLTDQHFKEALSTKQRASRTHAK